MVQEQYSGIAIFSVLLLVMGAVYIVLAIGAIAVTVLIPSWIVGVVAVIAALAWLALGVASFVIAGGLIRYQPWARNAVIVLSVVALVIHFISLLALNVLALIAIAFYAVTLYYFHLPEVVAVFSRTHIEHFGTYFEEYFPKMLREWDLVRMPDVQRFKEDILKRMAPVQKDLNDLQRFKSAMDKRLERLRNELETLEQ